MLQVQMVASSRPFSGLTRKASSSALLQTPVVSQRGQCAQPAQEEREPQQNRGQSCLEAGRRQEEPALLLWGEPVLEEEKRKDAPCGGGRNLGAARAAGRELLCFPAFPIQAVAAELPGLPPVPLG